jgi:hypothetical protein
MTMPLPTPLPEPVSTPATRQHQGVKWLLLSGSIPNGMLLTTYRMTLKQALCGGGDRCCRGGRQPQLPNKSTNKSECLLSIRFGNWIITGQSSEEQWLQQRLLLMSKSNWNEFTQLSEITGTLSRAWSTRSFTLLAPPQSSTPLHPVSTPSVL